MNKPKFQDYDGIKLTAESIIKSANMRKMRASLKEKAQEIELLEAQQEDVWDEKRAEKIAIQTLTLESFQKEIDRQIQDGGEPPSGVDINIAIKADVNKIKLSHTQLDKAKKECQNALDAYKQANSNWQKEARNLIKEYYEEIKAAGATAMNPELKAKNTYVEDYHVLFKRPELRRIARRLEP